MIGEKIIEASNEQVKGLEKHPALTVSFGWTVRGSLMDVKRNISNDARIVFKNVIFNTGYCSSSS